MVSGDIHQTRDAEPHRSISNNRDLQPGVEAPLAENKVMGAIYPSCLLGNESEPVTREASDKKPLGAKDHNHCSAQAPTWIHASCRRCFLMGHQQLLQAKAKLQHRWGRHEESSMCCFCCC